MSLTQELHRVNGVSKEQSHNDVTDDHTSESSTENKVNGVAHPPHSHQMFVPKYKHVTAEHTKTSDSCLTHGTEGVSYAGFRNLMVLVILVSNLRLMIENFQKYGVLICVACHDYRRQDLVLGAILFSLVPCHLFLAWAIEFFAARQAREAIGKVKKSEDQQSENRSGDVPEVPFETSWHVFAFLHFINITANLAVATNVVYYHIHHPGIGTLCQFHAVIVWLKTCSYAMTNRDLRHALLAPSKEPLPEMYQSCPYPRNLTVQNLAYFWWAPTLVYQPVYPRTEKIRLSFLFFRALEVVALSIAIWVASAQYAVPVLRNSLPLISELDVPQIIERLMKLSTISLFCWLAGFYAVFQSSLNFLAELLRFGDRDFYRDFWNSPNLRLYWKNWNRPVYLFMKRHVFAPLVARGCPPKLAQIIVFTFSAVLHEMLVGVPTHNILGIAFAGMMFQIPLIAITELFTKMMGMGGKTIGNCIFWISFVLVGQPLAALLYFFAWQAKYGSGGWHEFIRDHDMDFLSRFLGGVGPSTSRKPTTNDPQQRLTRFKKAYGQTLSVWNKLSTSKPDPVAVDTVRACLQRLTTLLHDDTRAPAPHLCLSFAASSQFYLTVSRIALSLNNDEIVREAVAWFNALVDNDEENLLNDDRFAEALMGFAENVSGPRGIAAGSVTEGEILELMFGIAAKIRLDPDLLPVWFMSEEQSSALSQSAGKPTLTLGDHKRFPLCYQFVGRVYHEGRAGDFARTGLLYIFESVSHSPELERWIIESDLPTLMASGLGALYSQLSRKLDITHPRENMPLILALSHEHDDQQGGDIDNFYSEGVQARLSTFMSNLEFWQDILEHCRSLEIKQTLIDHFQVFFLQQILYPSLLESSDIDGGSSVAVLTYLWRILESIAHPDLINLILQYLLALTEPLSSEPITPRSPAAESRRQSLLSLSQLDGGEEKLTPSFFNLTDLILASVTSSNPETLTAALRLTGTLLVKHHPYAYSTLFRVNTRRLTGAKRNYGAMTKEMNDYFSLVGRLGGDIGVDEAYENCIKDGLTLVESHTCSASKLGLANGDSAVETRHRSAILEDEGRTVQHHQFTDDDPLVTALVELLRTFFTNDIETNLGLTNVISHLAACPYTSLEGWLVADPKRYEYDLSQTVLTPDDDQTSKEPATATAESNEPTDSDPYEAEKARIGAFHAACRTPSWQATSTPRVLQVLQYLANQLEAVRPTVPNLDHLLASRRRAFNGLDEMEREASMPVSAARTPLNSSSPSRDVSRTRLARPDSPFGNRSSAQDGLNRGRSIAAVAGLQSPGTPSPSRAGARPGITSRPTSPTKLLQQLQISRPGSPTKAGQQSTPSRASSPTKLTTPLPNRTLSPLAAAVVTPAGKGGSEEQQPLSARSRSSIRSAEAQVLDRKLRFPVRTMAQDGGGGSVEREDSGGLDDMDGSGESKEKDAEQREASLSHVLTNIVILQEFVLELMALIQVRAALLDGEVSFV